MNDGVDIALIRYEDIPGIDLLQTLGERILAVAFLAYVVVLTYKILNGQKVDWALPLVRVGAGFAILESIPAIGDWILSVVLPLATTMGDESSLAMFGRAVATAIETTKCDESWWSASFGLMFSFKGWITLLSSVVYLLMYLVKFIVIDILWAVFFGLTLFLGVVAVPLGVMPGIETLRGWVTNLIEVSLWPLVFQFQVALLAGSFPAIIGAMAGGRVVTDCTGAAADLQSSGVISDLKFLAICCAYIVLLLFTPFLSAMIVRAAPVGIIGGIVAAKTAGLLKDVGKSVFQAGTGAVFGAGKAAAAGAVAAGGGGGGGAPSAAESLDNRNTGGN